MEFITENWEWIVGLIAVALPTLAYIAKRTKTTKDDQVVSVLEKFLSIFKPKQ